jgi:hypothetical protein
MTWNGPPSGTGSRRTSWVRTSSPCRRIRCPVSMSVASTTPSGPTELASIRATEPAPAPTSQHRSPGPATGRASRGAVTGSRYRSRQASWVAASWRRVSNAYSVGCVTGSPIVSVHCGRMR